MEVEPRLAKELLDQHIEVKHHRLGAVTEAGCKPERMIRPKADLDMSETTWRDFLGQWARFKRSTKVTGQDLIDHLVTCCSDSLRMDLRSDIGDKMDNLEEQELLKAMKKMAVRESNPMVHRNNLRAMKQGENEAFRNYVARLKEAAIDCNFSLECPADACDSQVCYTEEMIRDQAVYGMNCSDTQAKILAMGSNLLPLAKVISKAEAEEQARLTQTKLTAKFKEVEVSGVTTDYKALNDPNVKCRFCNQKGHGRSPEKEVRRKECPAWDKLCDKCKIKGHFKAVCRKKNDSNESTTTGAIDTKSKSDDAMFGDVKISDIKGLVRDKGNKTWKLEHIEWDEEARKWKSRKPMDMPKVMVKVEVLGEEHVAINEGRKHRGRGMENFGKVKGWSAAADTGAQITVAGPALLNKLNVATRDLIPVSQSITAANDTDMQILGGVLVRISIPGEGGITATKQLCYISKQCKGMFLSLSACKDLRLVPKIFPEPLEKGMIAGAKIESPKKWSERVREGAEAECGCPRRCSPPPLPEVMPEMDNKQLKDWILTRYAASAFNVCPHQRLPVMSGPPLHFEIEKGARPIATHVPSPVPVHWQAKVKEGLDADVDLGVLEKVPPNTPIRWLHRMVLAAKKDGSPRRTVDLSPLNKVCVRQTHHTRSPYHLACSIPRDTKKTCLDAWNGYHAVRLDEESKELTSFITQWGVYRYASCPQGFLASGDGYSHRYDEIVKDFGKLAKCIDDVALWGRDLEEIFWKTCKYLELCSKNGITFNPEKFQFGEDNVEFLGFEITKDSVKPSAAMLVAIRKFPVPRNISGVRSFFGLINQVSYAFSMASVMAPFRALLKSSAQFYWDDNLQDLFERAKEEIGEKIKTGVEMFDTGRTTCLATDWSRDGVGFFLMQKHCECQERKPTCCKEGWRITLAGSRFLRPNEEGWAPVEGEALAVVYALQKTRYFVLGCKDLIIATDHRPLLGVFGEKRLENIDNPRLRRLKEKTLAFRFTMVHVPGRKHAGPDAMSRNPVEREGFLEGEDTKGLRTAILAGLRIKDEEDCVLEEDPVHVAAQEALGGYVDPDRARILGVQAVTWERVQHETAMDEVLKNLTRLVEEGFPETKEQLPYNLREFFKHRENLSTCQGVILYNWRVLVPRSLRQEVLEGLHSGHQGVVGMKARASNAVFWPGIDAAIQSVRDRCKTCNTITPSQSNEPAIIATPPQYPFQQVCSDYFELDGATYVVMVDRYSGWPSIKYFAKGTANSQALIETLKEWFMNYGIPEEFSSDAGPCYVSAPTLSFFRHWGIRHRLSSVAFPHSNTRAELGVKSCKRMIRDNTGSKGELNKDKFARALLQYRNTPLQGIGLSPAQILFGREIRDFFPFAPGKAGIRQEWRVTADDREEALAKRHATNIETWNRNVKELSELEIGQNVFVQNQTGNYPQRWGKTGSVIDKGPGPRQYYIRMDGSRRVSLRNRKFLRKSTAVADLVNQTPESEDDQAVRQGARMLDREDIGDRPARDNLTYPQGVDLPRDFGESESSPGPGNIAQECIRGETSVGQTPGGEDLVGKRYPTRERKMNVKLKDFEVYALVLSE